MASTTARDVPLSRTRSTGLVLAGDADRARAFFRARLHTLLVKALRLALPVAALGLVAYYGLSLKLASGMAGLQLPTPPTITADDLVMNNPRYEGFGKSGERFVLTAKTAQQDLKDRSAPIRLATIDGRLTQPDQTVTDLKAARGTLDTRQSQLELFDGIEVVSQSGLRARLSRATVLTKEHRITSSEPVQVDMPTGSIRARGLAIDQRTRQVTFAPQVAARLTPERKPATEAAAATQTARAFGSGDQPIDITSERLDVDDIAKTAVFEGQVRAVQGEATLETARLDIEYEGLPGVPGTSSADAQRPAERPSSRVKRITAPGPVVMTQGGDRVTSDRAEIDGGGDAMRLIGNVQLASGADRQARADRADIDQKTDSVLLTGHVVVMQARNELKGRRLAIDRRSGRAQLTSPAAPGVAAGRISTRLYQGDGKDATPSKKTASAKPAASQAGVGGLSIKTDPSQPIDVEAASLDVNDTARTAIYRGDVRAAQGEFRMSTAEMTAYYVGQMGLNVAPGQQREAPSKGQQTQLTRIEARKGVTVTTADGQTVSGDWADFDVKANTVVIGGNVKIAQGAAGSQSFGHSGKLLVDLTTGEYQLLPDAAAVSLVEQAKRLAPGAAAAMGTVRPGDGAKQPLAAPFERPRMVIHPDHMKGIGPKPKTADAPSIQAGQPAGQAAAPPAGEATARKKAAPRVRAGDEPGSIFSPPGSN